MMMCLGVFLLCPTSLGLGASWKSVSFARLGRFSYLFKQVLNFLLLFFFWHPYDSDVRMFQVVPKVPKPLFIFLNFCFFLFFWMDVSFFLLFQIIALSPGFLLVTVSSLNILLYFTLGNLHLFFHFLTKLYQIYEHFDYQGFKFSIR
uniref:Secreted protein n=1 Tax=Desmodus rotundus TaxID=9430 RepID=K9IGF5_DESRO